MLYFKWILRVKLRNERGIKLTAAVYFPLKCHVKCVEGPENGVRKQDFSSSFSSSSTSSSWQWLLHCSPCSSCPHRDQIEDVEVKCSSCCTVFPHPDVGTEPKILHCTSKSYSAAAGLLLQWLGAFSQHFFLGRRPETLSLGRKSCRDHLAPKLEKGLGLQPCPCAWCYPEPRNSRFLLAPNGLYFFPEFREDTPLSTSE